MQITLKELVLTNWPIKILSVILGYTFWIALGSHVYTEQWVTIPISFYNISQGVSITAPDTVLVALYGTRINLNTLDTENLAAHIDAQKLQPGTQLLSLHSEQLLLPQSIRMVHYKPSNLLITVH
jgi:hypothetical protein